MLCPSPVAACIHLLNSTKPGLPCKWIGFERRTEPNSFALDKKLVISEIALSLLRTGVYLVNGKNQRHDEMSGE